MASKRAASGPKKTESQILAEIRKVANEYPDLVLWRLSQSGTIKRGGYTLRGGLSVNGASDLLGLYRGRFVAIEVKTDKGRVSDEQWMFLQLVQERGGFGVVCRSVDDFRQAVKRMELEDSWPRMGED